MLKSNKAEPKNESLENNERLQSKSKTVTKKFQCEICNIKISNEFNYSRHLKTCGKKSKFWKNSGNGFECLICPSQISDFKRLKQHFKDIHTIEKFFEKISSKKISSEKKDLMQIPTKRTLMEN